MQSAAAAALACAAPPAVAAERRQQRPRARGARCHAARQERSGAAGPAGGSGASSTPLDVLRNDFSFLEESTGLDLLSPLEAVAGAHDEVVAVLNPIAGEQMTRALEEQIAGMQAELAAAHVQIHRSEDRLRDSVQSLTELEASVARAFGASAPSSASASVATEPAAAPPPRQQERGQQQWQQAAASAAAAAAPPPQPRRPGPRGGASGGGAAGRARRGSGLASSLSIPEQLKDYWFPVEFGASLGEGRMVPFELFGQMWVLFRDEQGRAACVKDECAHRACPLSLGKVVGGRAQCAYHGWQFDGQGACTKMPSTSFCKGIRIESLPVAEVDGLVWVWPGRPEALAAAPAPPPLAAPPPGFQVHAELIMDVPVEHGLLLENLLDLAHAPFTHTTTFAKGWPVPDVVRFNAAQLLGGSWDPYPIDMQFGPPCMVLSTIGLASPGKIERGARAAACKNHLHQLHVCLPSSEGRTRLLYRMSLDFLHWTRGLPGIDAFWKSIASQVLGEDLVLVAGQQDRMRRGGDVWAHPVSYDRLGVRYRRWRNSVAAGDPAARLQAEAGLQPMSAGELFALDDAQRQPGGER